MQLAEVPRRLGRGDRDPLISVMNQLDRAAGAFAQLADMRLGE